MVDDPAEGVGSTYPGARVDAPVNQAASIARAICVDNTLRPAGDVRVSAIIRRTDASGRPAHRIHLALCVASARNRFAWTDR